MSKKYLTLEEAAQRVGVTTTELNRIREKGMIRAFADRGSWKFKDEDVENLTRSLQADSNPDISLSALGGSLASPEDTASELVLSEDESMSVQPTIISRSTEDLSSSDSDVRLVVSDDLKAREKPKPSGEDSDSDVKLAAPPSGSQKKGSDSDVKLVLDEDLSVTSSDSDVRLISSDSSGEVKLSVPGSSISDGSDSDVRLVSDKKKRGDSDLSLGDDSSEDIPLLADLPVHEEGTINLQPAGGSVLDDESGISLADESSIVLASDSGVTLEGPSDSGISLSDESALDLEESGISLADEPPLVKGKDAITETIPLVDRPLAASEDLLDTDMEVPLMADDSSEGDSTNIITLDDESASEEYETAETTAVGTDDVHAAVEELESEEEEAVALEDEIVGEDDELSEDVFGAADEDFEGEAEEAESYAAMPAAVSRGAPAEQEWGMMVSSLLVVSAALMIAAGTVAFDLVRNMWHTDQANQNPVASALLDVVKGM